MSGGRQVVLYSLRAVLLKICSFSYSCILKVRLVLGTSEDYNILRIVAKIFHSLAGAF